MHIHKNVFDNIVNTILDVDKISKDHVNARLDLKRLKFRTELHIDETQEKPNLPEANYYMTPLLKRRFCRVIKNTRFPDGHASNLFHKVRLEENILVGLKSRDCHIVMRGIITLAAMKTLPTEVALPLSKLCNYFKLTCPKVINVKVIEKLEEEILEIMCQLEKVFLPTFFDIMEYLVIHLATEVRQDGPVQFKNMWTTKMFMEKMMNMVHTRSHPEGSIAEGYVFDECLTFCSRYLEDCNTKFNIAPRHDDSSTSTAQNTEFEYLRILGRPTSACTTAELDYVSWIQAHRYVLFNYPKIE
jgi:hypothetical protein